MRPDVLQLAAAREQRGESFAIAIVVRREPASSAQVGNTAVIMEDGAFHGWLGGSCIQPTVVREALAALTEGAPRLITLSPDPGADRRAGVTVFPMTCHSGGSVDIYIEPVVAAPRLIVFGVSPAAQALARLGKALGYGVDAVDPDADPATFPEADRVITDVRPQEFRDRPRSQRDRLFAVVATLGQRDEEAAWTALAMEPAYVGVVASRRRFEHIRETLLARGVAVETVDRIRNPAGLDIGATAPEEVALSILAEIVLIRHAGRAKVAVAAEPPRPIVMTGARDAEALDPVCGMTVAVAGARHVAEHGGRTYYFCCGGCRERFLAAPDRYRASVASGGRA
jgi:xanthine dehydrogenase accessory factor